MGTQYQIRYNSDLHKIEQSDLNQKSMAEHFSQNGYDYLYVYDNGSLTSIITFQDFINKKIINGLNRNFIQKKNVLKNKEEVFDFYGKNPEVDKIVIIENDDALYEIDPLVELPMQNGIAKNLMSLRYIKFFRNEINSYLKRFSRILLIANKDIYSFLTSTFSDISFDYTDDIFSLSDKIANNYDVIFDFIYSRKIRKTISISFHVTEFCRIVTWCALKKLLEYSKENNITVKFYKLPTYKELICLNSEEFNNYKNRTTSGKLVKNEIYLRKYASTKNEYTFIKEHHYHSSLRLDNGYCFIQEESNDLFMHVHDGIRMSLPLPDKNQSSSCWHFYGPCTAYGLFVPDDMTVPSLVQQYAVENNVNIRVSNKAGIHGNNNLNSIMYALNTPVRAGDAFIFLDVLDDFPEKQYPDIQLVCNWFNELKSKDEIQFLDFPGHCNSSANKIMAFKIFDDMMKKTMNEYSHDEIMHTFTDYIYDPFEMLKLTNTSSIKFIRNYGNRKFTDQNYKNIGCILLSDILDYNQCLDIIGKSVAKCDALYVFKVNDIVSKINNLESLFRSNQIIINDKPVNIIQLEHYFNPERYLDKNLCCKECFESALYTEKVFLNVVLKYFGVTVRFFAASNGYSDKMKQKIIELYKSENINFIEISD